LSTGTVGGQCNVVVCNVVVVVVAVVQTPNVWVMGLGGGYNGAYAQLGIAFGITHSVWHLSL